MSDLIDRQQAINALGEEPIVWTDDDDYTLGERNQWRLDIMAIKALPSAQPEPEEFEWCTDCKEYDQTAHCCHRWTKVIRQTVAEIKAEQPERTGKWQITHAYPHNVHCSVCHKRFAQTHWAVWEDGTLPRNFCPNCGASMVKEGDEL